MNGNAGRLQGKVAIITGAARGMGATHARAFVAEGARVVLSDLAEDEGRALARELGTAAHFVRHDVSRTESWDEVLAATRNTFGPANVLLNNAAIYFIGPVDKAEPEQVRRLLEINVFGSWLGISRIAPMMREAGGGSIINLSSLAGLLGFPYHAIYGMSKWAIRGLTRSAANDLGPDGIRVLTIAPHANSPGLQGWIEQNPEEAEAFFRTIPLRRVGDCETDIGRAVAALCGPDFAYLTGATIPLDGGQANFD